MNKRTIRVSAILGAVFLLIAFLAPLFGRAAAKSAPDGARPTYGEQFRKLAPLTFTALVLGLLAVCAAVMLWLVREWGKISGGLQ